MGANGRLCARQKAMPLPPRAPRAAASTPSPTLHCVVVHHIKDDFNARPVQLTNQLFELPGSSQGAATICGAEIRSKG